MTRDPTVRVATIADAKAMDAINRKCLPENYPISEWESILKMMPKFSFVATVDGEIVGYCLCIINFDSAVIASIAVEEGYRSRGIGRKLLQQTIDNISQISRISYVTLNVRVSNITAQNLYNKIGFHKWRLIRKYYQDGEDAFLMRKLLQSSTT